MTDEDRERFEPEALPDDAGGAVLRRSTSCKA